MRVKLMERENDILKWKYSEKITNKLRKILFDRKQVNNKYFHDV